MSAVARQTFYDLAVRALEEQERHVADLRSRTGTLVAAAAVAATLLADAVFAGPHPAGAAEWLPTGVGLAGLVTAFAASVFLLRSHDMAFSVDAAVLLQEAEDVGAVDDIDEVFMALTYELSDINAQNRRTVVRLDRAFAVALTGLVFEVLGLGLAAGVV